MALEFRKEALQKLSSPDDLDRLMPVTDSRGWIALFSFGVLIAAVIIWGFYGKVPVSVPGVGITMASGPIEAIYIRTNGVLRRFSAKSGDMVLQGQEIAVVEQPELKESLEAARSESEFQRQHQQERQAFLKNNIRSLSERVERLNALLKEGLVEKTLVITAGQDLMNAKNELYGTREKGATTDNHYNATQYNYKWQTVLTAPCSGKVTEVQYNDGDFVNAGRYLLMIEKTDGAGQSRDGLVLYMYVASGNAKSARKGMTVLVSPSTVAAEEYGQMIGDVISVSDYPETPASIENDTNESLAQKFSASGPVYKIVVRLRRDASSYSGYCWTSGKGPRVKITSGTLSSGQIDIEDRRPVDLVVPIFKKYILGEGR